MVYIDEQDKSYDGILLKPELDDALAHYGVMGMKWGVRKDPVKAYRKATAKLDKLKKKSGIKAQRAIARTSKKAAKYQKKYAKANAKYAKYLGKRFANKEKIQNLLINKERAAVKSMKAQTKANNAIKKGAVASKRQVKWERAMNDAFKNVDLEDVKKKIREQDKKMNTNSKINSLLNSKSTKKDWERKNKLFNKGLKRYQND